MELDGGRSHRHSEKVDTTGPDTSGESTHPTTFLVRDCVDGVTSAGDGPHLDNDDRRPVAGDDVDLATVDDDVGGFDLEIMLGEPPRGQPFSNPSQGGTGVGQRLSSVFSSFSTLTSRKVSTWTFSRNRAGRNMSQTQASLMVTSK